MAYTTIDDPSAHFQIITYSGNGASRSITNTGNSDLKPDWVWIKERNNAISHRIFDSNRGATKRMFSNNDDAESTQSNSLTAFNTDGFSLGDGGSVNGGSDTYVAFQWAANGGTTSSNTDGTITTTVQANTTAGFSIATFTGNGASQTVGHGLNQAPVLSIRKKRETTGDWFVHTNVFDGGMDYLRLNTTAASSGSSLANFTSTTSAADDNSNQYVVYFFHSVKGYSKIGTYKGNGNADGPFIYTGFKVAWIMFKKTSDTGDWIIMDAKRTNEFNPTNGTLYANLNNAEATSIDRGDCVSNGYKLRNTSAAVNTSGATYIYMAFAEHPFVSSEGVPVTAR